MNSDSEQAPKANPTEPAASNAIRKPIILPTETTSDDGSRSVTKDRLPGDIVTDAVEDAPPVVRKPIVIEPQTEA